MDAEIALKHARERILAKPKMHRIYMSKKEANLNCEGIGINGGVILHPPYVNLKVNDRVVRLQ